jgi:hypothetical protein
MRVGVGVVIALLVATHVAVADVAITRVGVRVAAHKTNGDKWDRGFGSEPDPKLEVVVAGKIVQTCPMASDTFETDCAVAAPAFEEGTVVEMRVTDVDLASDDDIGVARGTLLDTNRRYDLAHDGAVENAWIEVTHADGPSIGHRLVTKLGARGVGAALGVGIALLLFKLIGAKLLTPREPESTGHKPTWREKQTRFWRSPILLASAGASTVGMLLAVVLRDPKLPLVLGCFPYVLGGFAAAATIIDAHAHEHLGGKRLRLLIAAGVVLLAVPLFDLASSLIVGLGFIARHLGWVMVLIVLLCLA